MLMKHELELQAKEEVTNKIALKAMFTVSLYMVKHRLPNDSFEALVKLLADAGCEDIKKYLLQCPKNATYLSL